MATSILVAGGGPGGLALAYFLRRLLPAVPVTVQEASTRWGGWLATERVEGFQFERGCRGIRANSAAGAVALQLVQHLGLAPQALPADSSAARRYIWWNGALHAAPASLRQALAWAPAGDKGVILRALLAPSLPAGAAGDESVREFVTRHCGSAVADNVVDAVLSGVYAGDTAALSLDAVLPALREVETAGHGSLALGMVARWALPPSVAPGPPPLAQHLPPGIGSTAPLAAASSVNFVRGMGTLPAALHAALSADPGATLLAGVPLAELPGDGAHVFLATPAAASAAILRKAQDAQLQAAGTALAGIPTASVATVCMGWRTAGEGAVLQGHSGFGYLVPTAHRTQAPGVLGTVFDSCAFPSQAPGAPGAVRTSVMMGGATEPGLVAASDGELAERGLAALRAHVGGGSPPPDVVRVFRARDAIPQYNSGHMARVGAARAALEAAGGSVALLGNSVDGVGIADVLAAAWRTAWSYAGAASRQAS